MKKLLGIFMLCFFSISIHGCERIARYVRACWYAQSLCEASYEGDINRVAYYLAHGAHVDSQMSKHTVSSLGPVNTGHTALHLAVMAGREDVVTLLLTHEADTQSQDWGGKTPLHHATRCKSEVMMQQLLLAGANVNARDEHGITPLHEAVMRGDPHVVSLLVEHGADVNAGLFGRPSIVPWIVYALFNHEWGWTPLHVAVRAGDRAMVELLLEHKADMHREDVHHETPLQLAERVNPYLYEFMDEYRCTRSMTKGIVTNE